MSRFILPLSIAAALVSAFFLYGIKHDTRALEAQVLAHERAIEKAVTDIAVLKAERAHLSRPERIEPLARALGLQPPSARQILGAQVFGRAIGDTREAGRRPVAAGPGDGAVQ